MTERKELESVTIQEEDYFKISNVDQMRPFFMTIVSPNNHWLFISSNGGLSAGRKNSENALFPYYTDDKITQSIEHTGSKTIVRLEESGQIHLWEPFSVRHQGIYSIERNLYKNTYGTKVIFEEINHDLELAFRYQWSTSQSYGFIKQSHIRNNGDVSRQLSLLDGLQNILPACVDSGLQQGASNLVDAYKRSELVSTVHMGLYALSAIIVDKAEPSEALRANIAWSTGLTDATYLLSSHQLNRFRNNLDLKLETDVKAEKGAYFVASEIELDPQGHQEWLIVADVAKSHSAVVAMIQELKSHTGISESVKLDIERGKQDLIDMVGCADGIQLSGDALKDARHFSNCMFNIMRGGIFDHNYTIESADFSDYLKKSNAEISERCRPLVQELKPLISISELKDICEDSTDPDFKRLCYEYLPLRFSRRHGDPSRPWNRFSINTQRENDNSKILDFEGNWRDIFQNWEALAYSYPDFIDGIIFKFLNASTADGYNPYRITKGGIDWETIEPDDPWAYIGYWGDHQIIYLLKLLEHLEDHYPGRLQDYLSEEIFVYANVPYRINSYRELLKDPKSTVTFESRSDLETRTKMSQMGSDGALLTYDDGTIVRANFIEKILVTTLAKLSNFIPEGGIWMNTQRPEWNDANNALVGNGVSMVTLCYLNRFLKFLSKIIPRDIASVSVAKKIEECLRAITAVFERNKNLLTGSLTDIQRRVILDGLGQVGSDYRLGVYEGFSKDRGRISGKDLHQFITLALDYTQHSIRSNKRDDGLYHAYNLMTVVGDSEIQLSRLDPMLEGQVAVLSSGELDSRESLEVLDALRQSELYRPDQDSYMLYPNKQLPGFLDKNVIDADRLKSSKLVEQLVRDKNMEIIEMDPTGQVHFNPGFHNVSYLEKALEQLDDKYGELVSDEKNLLSEMYEEVFNHKAFTGRSGTFYGYEGLGSIYWHMVSKLLLATYECIKVAADSNPSNVKKLTRHFKAINEGIGLHKPASVYGAFPTDPYSHTPGGKGAQQPGMTGQVKEDILSRFGELGIQVVDGMIHFSPFMLALAEFVSTAQAYRYQDVAGQRTQIPVPNGSIVFTYCQVPIYYVLSATDQVTVTYQDGGSHTSDLLQLDRNISQQIFHRTNKISCIRVMLDATRFQQE